MTDAARCRASAVLAAGAATAWANAALPRLSARFGWGRDARTAATLLFCAADSAVSGCTRIPPVFGFLAGGALAVVGATGTASVPREKPSNLYKWILLDIPVGTALPEEVLFRGALTPAFERGFGCPVGSVLGAVGFGLWHIGAARSARDPILRTILVTSGAGYLFDELRRRTRRLWPSFAAHWALNSTGAILSSSSVFSSSQPNDP